MIISIIIIILLVTSFTCLIFKGSKYEKKAWRVIQFCMTSFFIVFIATIVVSCGKIGVTYTETKYDVKEYDFQPCFVTEDDRIHQLSDYKMIVKVDKDTKTRYVLVREPNNTFFAYGPPEYYLMVPEK